MQPQQPAAQQDLAQWLKAFEQQKKALDQQVQQFDALQQELQALAVQAPSSPKAVKKLEQLKALEQNVDYVQLRDRALSQIMRLEQQFSQLVDWCDGPPITSSTNQRQSPSAVAKTPAIQQAPTKKTARGFA